MTNNIRMVDLKTQYLKVKKEIDTSIHNIIDNSSFINGPEVKTFTGNLARYMDCKHVIPCANGTDALQVAMMSLNLKPGDEVITSDFTFIATVEVIALLGLKLVLVDVDPETFNLDVDQVKRAITSKTKAIVPVHLFGQCAPMEDLLELAAVKNLFIIEDAAQSLGSIYTFKNGESLKSGTLGHIGCTSFFPSKNLGCFGDGGAIFTRDDNLAEKISSVVNHGSKIKYYHDDIGVNSRLDTIQAAILNVKLKYLDQYNSARRKAADYYDKHLGEIDEISIPARSEFSTHIFHQYTIKIKNGKRDGLKNYLQEKNIPSMIYYPVPLHLQNGYRYLGYREGDFPVTEGLCKTVLSLPMHTELDENQLKYIVESVKSYFA
ncbi:MAG: DegT/DnrJ/EryC1/StrS family aminotransferase [Bacteroidota bacterium]